MNHDTRISPYLLPAFKLDHETRDRVCAQYDWHCPFCFGGTTLRSLSNPVYYIVPPILKGRSQMIWLAEAGLISNNNDFDPDEDDNLIILCEEHRRRFAYGSFFLCPSLEDLKVLLEWEERWARESHAETVGSHSKTQLTREVPPEALSGHFSLLYTTGFSDNMLTFGQARMLLTTNTVTPSQIAYSLPLRERDTYPVLNVNAGGTEPPSIDLLFRLNTPTRPGRINPYKVLVRALELVGCSFIPADVFRYELDDSMQMVKEYPVAGSNPMEQYRAILLKLKDLYSVPYPLDDDGDDHGSEEEGSNTNPVPVPAEDPSPGTWLGEDRCVLCGETDEELLCEQRVPADPEGDNDWAWHSSWVGRLGLLNETYRYTPNSLTSHMKLCTAHSDAYTDGVWRWIPSAEERKEMAELTVEVKPPTRYDERGYIVYDTSEPEESDDEKPEITFEAARYTCFDLLIFFPPMMPLFRRDKDGKLLPIDDGERVVPNRIRMRLDREVTFAVALATLGTVYWPPPDDKLKEIEDECLRIRDRWNAQVPRNTVPCTNLRVRPIPPSGTARSEAGSTDSDDGTDTDSDGSDNDSNNDSDTSGGGDNDAVQDD